MSKGVMSFLVALLLADAASAATLHEASLKAELMDGKTVKDVLLTDSGAVYVGVLDNGSSRNGFARYVCEVVRGHAKGGGSRLIRIIDIATASRGEGFKTLGQHSCTI